MERPSCTLAESSSITRGKAVYPSRVTNKAAAASIKAMRCWCCPLQFGGNRSRGESKN